MTVPLGPPLEGSFEEWQEVHEHFRRHRRLTTNRAWRGDPGVYEPNIGELVRIAGIQKARFKFLGYGRDAGGDYAIVIGGLAGHRLERCVTVDRVQRYVRGQSGSVVRSITTDSETGMEGDDDDET